ncbi:MAG: universal stress protein [Xanthomonadaceae bacterium]|nr:universal stress protein [Xanthomonadaceae bacterium]
MYKRILVGVDGSDASLRGLDEAVRLAKTTGGQLLLVHVVNHMLRADFAAAAYYDKVIEALREGGNKVLDQAASRARKADVPCETKLVDAFGDPAADLIVGEAKAWPADLIVLGTHGRRGLKRLALGSDAELVLRMAPVPVLLVRTQSDAASA